MKPSILPAATFAGIVLAILFALPAAASDLFPDKLVSPSSIQAGTTAEVTLEVTADLSDATPFPLDVILVLDGSETMGQPISKDFDAIDVAREIAQALSPPEDCGGDPEIDPELPIELEGAGDHVIEWTAQGVDGMLSSCDQTIAVVDGTAPTLVGVPADTTVECDAVPPPPAVTADDNCDPDPEVVFDADDQVCLWPPNHRIVLLSGVLADVQLVDNCDPDPELTVLGCASDQCDDAPCAEHPGENGEGHTQNDCSYDEATDLLAARAERAGTDAAGRNYALTGQAVDSCGNQSGVLDLFRVHMPHDQSPRQDCVSAKP